MCDITVNIAYVNSAYGRKKFYKTDLLVLMKVCTHRNFNIGLVEDMVGAPRDEKRVCLYV